MTIFDFYYLQDDIHSPGFEKFFQQDYIKKKYSLEKENEIGSNFLFQISSSCFYIGLFVCFDTTFILNFDTNFVLNLINRILILYFLDLINNEIFFILSSFI